MESKSKDIKVFVSYSHDSDEHAERVRSLADRLRYDGIDCTIDQYVMAPEDGWRQWMTRQMEWADFVLMVCTETYDRRVRGDEQPGKGLGAIYEGSVLLQLLYDAGMKNDRAIPVLFEELDVKNIPIPLRQYMRYRLWDQYEDLYRNLTGQPSVVPPSLGRIRELPPRPPAWGNEDRTGDENADVDDEESKPHSRSDEVAYGPEAGDDAPGEEEHTGKPSEPSERSEEPEIEMIVGGNFRLLHKLGEGGFGTVYAARDETLKRRVAIKLLSLTPKRSQATDEVLAEAQTLARLEHENIVPVIAAGLEGDSVWIAMRLVEGESLDQLIEHSGALPPQRVFTILRQLAHALRHAHRKGIIHRDLKPSNIIIGKDEDSDEREKVWLTDFGLAKVVTGQTASYEPHIAGTLHYMSPEQITGRRVDSRTDLFALGCIAVELLTGERPFAGNSFEAVRDSIVHRSPGGLDRVAEIAGKPVAKVLRQWLAKSPADRRQSAEDVLQDLESLLDSESRFAEVGWIFLLNKFLGRRKGIAHWDGHLAVDAEGVRKSYTFRSDVLKGLDLRVPAGSFFGLLGRNGSGKTTLLRVLAGLYRADGGKTLVFGRDPWKQRMALLPRIGHVPEVSVAFEWMKVSEHLAFLRSMYDHWDKAYVYDLLKRFDLPLDGKISSLSRGMKTQLSLVSALGHRPDLLILDDPTLGLDAVILESFLETLSELTRREGVTVLVASHNHEDFERIMSHVAFFKNGRILLTEDLDRLKLRTRQVVLTFSDEVPRLEEIENFRLHRISGRRASGAILDTSSGVLERLQAFGPEKVELEELSLREIFVNYLR